MSIPERVKTKMKSAGLKGVNKPQRLNDDSGKSHHVMASEGVSTSILSLVSRVQALQVSLKQVNLIR